MFCYKCGSKIPDNAQFCPFCGEVLDKIVSTPKETSLSGAPISESDLMLSLGGDSDVIVTTQYISKEITLFIENLSSSPIYQIELQLSGPSHVYIPPASEKFRVIESHTTQRATISIMPNKQGNFTLNATLLYGSGHSMVVPINLQVNTTSVAYQESLRTHSETSKAGSFVAIAFILGFIGLILVGFGVSTAFSSLQVGITMVVIGIIIFSIATQGKCFLCFLGCDGCDGCDCDC
jgi:hypothetical protein